MTPKIQILIGVSGSGKSTYCYDFLRKNKGWARVNRDDVRQQLVGKLTQDYYRRPDLTFMENLVSKVIHENIRLFILQGLNVIIDNTNLKQKFIKEFIDKYNHLADIQFKVFDEKEHVLTERLKSREGNEYKTDYILDQLKQFREIQKIYKDGQYLPKTYPQVANDPSLPRCVLVDLDGTLALFGDKNPYSRDFENDDINTPVYNVLVGWQYLNNQHRIIFFSGRDSKYREQTVEFLEKKCILENKCKFDYLLYMREEGDVRKDSIVKTEMYNKYIADKYHVEFVIDDRLQVCEDVWYKLGLFCFNVNQNLVRF